MSTLIRWDPFRDMMTLRKRMDRLFDEMLEPSRIWPTGEEGYLSLALDVAEKDDSFLVKASVPGIDPNDLEITLTDNVLTIKGEMQEEKETEEERYHLRERRYGRFMRSVTLPVPVEDEKVEATYENGVLALTLPKAEAVKPKKIAIKAGKVIER